MTKEGEMIQAFVRIDPERAKRMLRALYRQAGASKREVGRKLDCTEQTIQNWLHRLDAVEEFAAMKETAKERGWHHENLGGAHLHKKKNERSSES